MNPRTTAAIAAARTTSWASRRLLRRGGTALPGLVAERLDSGILATLGRQLERTVLITGTNGKTTTARLLSAILEEAACPVLHNRAGSNLTRGIASALAARASLSGRLPGGDGTTGLFEVDEATLPAATAALGPAAIVFTNLFRDQLDRYGEVDSVAALWRAALRVAPAGCTLVLNADDPSVAELACDYPGPVHWFGIDAPELAGERGAFDARWCGRCGADYEYEYRYFAHAGRWRCTGCGRARPDVDTGAREIEDLEAGTRFSLTGVGPVETRLSGLYNAWNALAAAAAARVLAIPAGAIVAGLGASVPAFGRGETVTLGGRKLRLLLVKNPAGANQALRSLAGRREPLDLVFLLNDRFADGQDVSWTWDVDFELLGGRVARARAGGDRGADAALRLHYAGLMVEPPLPAAPGAALDALLAEAPVAPVTDVILTYTALLDLRAELARRGAVASLLA